MNSLSSIKTALPPLLLGTKVWETTAKRGHVVLKRRFPIRLHKKDQPPKLLRSRERVYEIVKYTDQEKKDNIDVILTSYVEGLGQPGDSVSVRPFAGYEKLLVTGKAVYSTPENIERFSELSSSSQAAVHNSKFSAKTTKMLQYRVVGIPMNDSQPWTMEPWHVRAGFRLNGIIVPDSAIEMPPRTISGPSKEQNGKEFYVTISVSKTEKSKVRCRLQLTGIHSDPVQPGYWIDDAEPLFEEDRAVLDGMPRYRDLPVYETLRMHFNRF